MRGTGSQQKGGGSGPVSLSGPMSPSGPVTALPWLRVGAVRGAEAPTGRPRPRRDPADGPRLRLRPPSGACKTPRDLEAGNGVGFLFTSPRVGAVC